MECNFALTQLKGGPFKFNLRNVMKISYNVYFSSSTVTDSLIDNLVLEVGGKRERVLSKYFERSIIKPFDVRPIKTPTVCNQKVLTKENMSSHFVLIEKTDVNDLINALERKIACEDSVPNNTLNYLLIYFAKQGNIAGVKAVQLIVKKYNVSHFKFQSGYDHYLAEALWINGRIEDSLKLFIAAYDNAQVREKVKIMLTCLFPLLIKNHGESVVRKTIYAIERISTEKNDQIILGYLWKELFLSIWFSDQQLSNEILQKNPYLLIIIQWMVPNMGKELLKSHKIEDFHRLLQFTLENKLKKFEGLLVRLLFDYYYIHQQVERCSAIIKYSSSCGDSLLTEEQERRYVNLLLKGKISVQPKVNVKIPQNMKYKF